MSTLNADMSVVLSYENIQITENDLECLKPRKYINDKIINFYLKFMHKTLLNHEQQQKVHIFDSFFAEALDQMDEERAVRWLRRVNFFEKDFLLIPVNLNEHWLLMIICYPTHVTSNDYPLEQRPRILTMDSAPEHAIEKKQQILFHLKVFIRCACVIQRNATNTEINRLSRCIQNIDVDVREQTNNFDCGLFLMENAEKFLIKKFGLTDSISDPEVEFRLSGSRAKRAALCKLIDKLAEVIEIEKSVINSSNR